MANFTDDELKQLAKATEELKKQAELRQQISSSLEGYMQALKDLGKIQKNIKDNTKLEEELKAKILKLEEETGDEAKDLLKTEKAKLKILEDQNDLIKAQAALLVNAVKTVNKGQMLLVKGGAAIAKGLDGIIKGVYANLRSSGLFEMDKAIKQSALSMGLLSDQSKSYAADILAAADSTTAIGVGVEQLAKMQSDYSDEIGRTIMLNQNGLKAVSAIAAATGLGADGAAKMAAAFEKQGFSAENTKDFVEKAMQDASHMGLTASKLIKNVSEGMSLLNKYNFKKGIDGMKEMAKTMTKLGVDMDTVAPMADKLFDIDGAVNMSAQLQVMGGAWAKLADPFHLMYMARNDMTGLADEVTKAAEASVHFNKQAGSFDISALEMNRLRKIADETGLSYDKLATAAKAAAQVTTAKSQIGYSFSKEAQDFLSDTAKFDKNDNGKASVMLDIDGKQTKKFLSELNGSDQVRIETTMKEKKSLEEYAKGSQTFDDSLNNLIMKLKTDLFPIVKSMDENLIPKINSLVKWLKDSKATEVIQSIAKTIGDAISTFGGIIIDHPILTLGLIKGISIAFTSIDWLANGYMLAKGFNLGTAGEGGIVSAIGKTMGPAGSILGRTAGAGIAAIAGTAIGIEAGKVISSLTGNKDTKSGDKAGMWAGGLSAAIMAAGVLLAPETFGTSLLASTALAGGVGGIGGKIIGDSLNQDSPTRTNDNINDGVFPGLGGSHGRGIIQNGAITPINNKDDLLAMKSDGPIAKNMSGNNGNSIVKHEFGDINITGQLMVNTPGNTSLGVDLLRDPEFIRSISKKITVELEITRNQVQKG